MQRPDAPATDRDVMAIRRAIRKLYDLDVYQLAKDDGLIAEDALDRIEYRLEADKPAPVSASHDWVWHPAIYGRQIVECRRCGKFDSYRPIAFTVKEPPKEPCYGR